MLTAVVILVSKYFSSANENKNKEKTDIKIDGIKVNKEKKVIYFLFALEPSIGISFLIEFLISKKIIEKKTSNNKMFEGWWLKHRWFDKEMAHIYGADKIKHLTAKKGDLLIATTNGWHKGEKLVSGTRTMLTINFLVHPELAGGVEQDESKRFKISQKDFDNLPDWKKPVSDFLIKVQNEKNIY